MRQITRRIKRVDPYAKTLVDLGRIELHRYVEVDLVTRADGVKEFRRAVADYAIRIALRRSCHKAGTRVVEQPDLVRASQVHNVAANISAENALSDQYVHHEKLVESGCVTGINIHKV